MGFEIVEWAVGGGVLGLSPMPSGAQAKEVLQDWQPDVVVSLTSTAEIDAFEAGEVLQGGTWRWEHHPIEDFGTPDLAFEETWPALANDLLAQVQDGARVLVHCRGGCGRSGMVVLALMVAIGREARQALGELRAKRPCAVETDGQMVWATQGVLHRA